MSFTQVGEKNIQVLQLTVSEHTHPSGARHFHLQADDREQAFCVAFPTVPLDSTGVAHILEHTVLCGSKHYPARDPFFMMLKRSLSTFMNALTASDWTAYPFATCNAKDYDNLMSVYLDAVFFPNLHELDFAQEGIRLDFAQSQSDSSNEQQSKKLAFHGVVFNEMKGEMSNPHRQLYHRLYYHLFASQTYHHNSGGDPKDIPNLTVENLRKFHREHYNLGNSLFFTYGPYSPTHYQSKLDSLLLSQMRTDQEYAQIKVDDEIRITEPIRVLEHYPASAGSISAQPHVVLAWLLGHNFDVAQRLDASLVESLLLDDAASPLLRALQDTELASSASSFCGLDADSREMVFMAGLENAQVERADEIEQLIFSTLREVAQNPEKLIGKQRVADVIYAIELRCRNLGGSSFPRGLELIVNNLSLATHKGDLLNALDVDAALAGLRERFADLSYLGEYITKNFLENQHMVRLSFVPDSELLAQQAATECQQLEQLEAKLDEQQSQQISQLNADLLERQSSATNDDCLPKLSPADIPDEISLPAVEVANDLHTSCQVNANGVIYSALVRPMFSLDQVEQIETLQLYRDLIADIGTDKQDYLGLASTISACSLGIGVGLETDFVLGADQPVGFISLGAVCLPEKHHQLLELLYEVSEQTVFSEQQRIIDLISEKTMGMANGVLSHGHRLAMLAASSYHCTSNQYRHQMNGLAAVRRMSDLFKQIESKQFSALELQLSNLDKLQQKIVQMPAHHFLVCDQDNYRQALESIDQVAVSQTRQPSQALDPDFYLAKGLFSEENNQRKQAWLCDTQVNYCARSFRVPDRREVDVAAALMVLEGLLHHGYLHTAIREKGGAYGGGASYDLANGTFGFFSYRDPRLQATYQDFSASLKWLMENKHSDQQIDEAILLAIGKIDRPVGPISEGRLAIWRHNYKRDQMWINNFRQKIKHCRLADLRHVAETYLIGADASEALISAKSNAENLAAEGYLLQEL